MGSTRQPANHHYRCSSLYRVARAAFTAVLLDLLAPSLVLLGLAAVSLAVRRQGLGTLGCRRPARPGRMCLQVVGTAVAWTVLTFVLIKPLLERLIGQQEGHEPVAGLQGDLPTLLGLLALAWTLTAFGEELGYRGLLPTRLRDVLSRRCLRASLMATSVPP